MPNFNPIGSRVSEPQVAENRSPIDWRYRGFALTTAYALALSEFISMCVHARFLCVAVMICNTDRQARRQIADLTRSSAIAERPRCTLFKLWLNISAKSVQPCI